MQDINFTRNLVLVQDEYGSVFPLSSDINLPMYVPVSTSLEVVFIPLPSAQVIQGQLDALDEQEFQLQAAFSKKLLDIETRRGQLLALPAPTGD